jgi:hypothetical protein
MSRSLFRSEMPTPPRGWRPTGSAAVLGLVLAACGPGSDRLLDHDGGEYHFRYPARWTLTHDTFDVATPDSRIVALRSTDGTVMLVHSFAPASELSAEQFADAIARERRDAIVELGVGGGEVKRQVPQELRIGGALREGVRQEFELASGGLRFAQVALFFRVEAGAQELFFSIHSPADRAPRAQTELAQVLESLRIDLPRTAYRDP